MLCKKLYSVHHIWAGTVVLFTDKVMTFVCFLEANCVIFIKNYVLNFNVHVDIWNWSELRIVTNKSIFSFLHTLTTWHYPHSPAAAAARRLQSVDVSCPPGPQQQTCRSVEAYLLNCWREFEPEVLLLTVVHCCLISIMTHRLIASNHSNQWLANISRNGELAVNDSLSDDVRQCGRAVGMAKGVFTADELDWTDL